MNDRVTDIEVMPSNSMANIDRAEIDVQIATAKQYPRSIKRFMESATQLATINRATARSTFYRLPRKQNGKEVTIEGPSIRMAEIAASTYGNIRSGAEIVEVGERTITARGVCIDLETNNAFSVQVTASIWSKYGKRFPDHMIATVSNAACAKARRNAILGVVPRAFIDQIVRECKDVAMGKDMTMGERWKEIVDLYAKHGVGGDKLMAHVGKSEFSQLTVDDITNLYGLLTAIEDGDISPRAAFNGEAEREEKADPPAAADTLSAFREGKTPDTKPPSEPEPTEVVETTVVLDEPEPEQKAAPKKSYVEQADELFKRWGNPKAKRTRKSLVESVLGKSRNVEQTPLTDPELIRLINRMDQDLIAMQEGAGQ